MPIAIITPRPRWGGQPEHLAWQSNSSQRLKRNSAAPAPSSASTPPAARNITQRPASSRPQRTAPLSGRARSDPRLLVRHGMGSGHSRCHRRNRNRNLGYLNEKGSRSQLEAAPHPRRMAGRKQKECQALARGIVPQAEAVIVPT